MKKEKKKKKENENEKKRKWLLPHALRYSIEFKIEKKEKENQGLIFWKNGFFFKELLFS